MSLYKGLAYRLPQISCSSVWQSLRDERIALRTLLTLKRSWFVSLVKTITQLLLLWSLRCRQWPDGDRCSSQATSASKRLFGSSQSVDCQSVFHHHTSFPWDLGNGMSFSQKSMPSTSSSSLSALFICVIDGTSQSKWPTLWSSSKNQSYIWMTKESRRGIATVF